MCWPVPWSCRVLSILAEVWTGRRCAGTSASGTCGSWYGGSCWRWPRSATGGGRHTAAPVAIDEVNRHDGNNWNGLIRADLTLPRFPSSSGYDEVTPPHPARQPGLVAGGLAGGTVHVAGGRDDSQRRDAVHPCRSGRVRNDAGTGRRRLPDRLRGAADHRCTAGSGLWLPAG